MSSNPIQWFPGHMAKTRRLMQESLGQVDIVLELLDARIPYSSKNPEIERLLGTKPKIAVLTKSALANPEVTRAWVEYYKQRGVYAVVIDNNTGAGIGTLEEAVRTVMCEKLERYQNKGMGGRKLKAMIVGIPNVGKSSLINKLAGAKKAKVENRPGVTMNKPWVTTSNGIELLDMPGVLWPKFDDTVIGENLAATGAIKDAILDTESLAGILCTRLIHIAPDLFCARYKLGDAAPLREMKPHELLELVGRKRGFLISGGEVDTERAANILLEEFRAGKIGRITLDVLPVRGDGNHADACI